MKKELKGQELPLLPPFRQFRVKYTKNLNCVGQEIVEAVITSHTYATGENLVTFTDYAYQLLGDGTVAVIQQTRRAIWNPVEVEEVLMGDASLQVSAQVQ